MDLMPNQSSATRALKRRPVWIEQPPAASGKLALWMKFQLGDLGDDSGSVWRLLSAYSALPLR
jgi:hypothetical protein